MMTYYSIYLHIPFCRHRCAYCDFNTYAGMEALIPDYTNALVREIQLVAQSAGHKLPVHTVFFGGGTPSLLPPMELQKILEALHEAFDLQPGVEITLEANPGTLSEAALKNLYELGVNRLSLGVQSTSPEELRLLERSHGPEEVRDAVRWARQAGFDNLNLDLIFGLPFQSLADWERSLGLALSLRPEHFSLYALTLEHGTPMQGWVQRGLLPEPDADLAADMYELASERLEKAGYLQYEISNWAQRRPASGGADPAASLYACRHNLQYWRGQPYLGLGAGAHGYVPRLPTANGALQGLRTVNVLAPRAYIERLSRGEAQPFPRTPATVETIPVDREAEIGETMMMGLRLVQEGVSARSFYERFGEKLEQRFAREVRSLIDKGLLEWGDGQARGLRLTSRGRLLGNQVFVEFI